jgi:hypothetical protein
MEAGFAPWSLSEPTPVGGIDPTFLAFDVKWGVLGFYLDVIGGVKNFVM